MWRPSLVLPVVLLLLPAPSSAIELHWSSGADTLSFTSATRCTLIVQADSTEATLPNQWRLLWLADSSGVNATALDPSGACATDTAKVSAIDPPATPADSAAHVATVHFCSAGPSARTACYVLDQPGGSRGRLKVAALDPTDPDSSRVIESNEVMYNGRVDGDYAPVLLRASSVHETALLQVRAFGAGLSSIQSMRVGAPDDLWSVPLRVAERSDTRVTATADVYVPLPQAVVQAGSSTASSDQAPLAADLIGAAEAMSAGSDTILFRDPNPSVYPKDFAFHFNTVYDPTHPGHPWKALFHLLYIRNKAGLDSIIAHAWTDSLGKAWSVDSLAFRPSGHGWDKKKCWAPSIQQVGNLTYMFYTGVDSLDNQTIGYATTEMLGTTNISWARSDTAVYKASNTAWAHVGTPTQFRDPFVMPDPDATNYPGRYLLFNTGEDKNLHPYYTIGVARNEPGTLTAWRDLENYEATDHNHLALSVIESPLVVRDSLTGAWRMFVANAWYDPLGHNSTIFLTETIGDSLTDIRASEWPQRDTLYHYAGDDADVIGWQACEHLQIGQVHFFAAYEGTGIGITRMHWDPVTQKFIFVHPDVTGVPAGLALSGVRFFLAELRPTAGIARFALESASAISPRVVVYDVMGRQVRKLTDGRAVRGRGEVTWDCHDESGRRVASGIYFARMTGAGRAQVVRVPIIR